MSTILVLGAGGNVGTPLVGQLLANGHTVRAASRSGKAVGGAQGLAFDYSDSAGIARAFEGVDSAYVMLPAGQVAITQSLLPVIEAAASRGVKVVLQSVMGANADPANPYRQVELALEGSGTRWTILRPNWFADNFHTYWLHGINAGEIAVPAGEGRSSFIDTRDIAASAAAALVDARFDGSAWDLTGPQAFGYADAADQLTALLGRPVVYRDVDPASFVAGLISVGVSQDYAHLLAAIFEPVRLGLTAPVTDAVERLTGQAPRSLGAYLADHAGAWNQGR